MNRPTKLGFAAAAAAIALHPGLAAPPAAAGSTPEPVKELAACRAIAGAAERLACYDRAAEGLQEAIKRQDVVIVDKQEMQRTRRSLFGFTLPRIGPFKGQEEEKEITTTVAGVRSIGNGLWELRLPDGAVWQTVEANSYNDDPRTGQKIVIKRGLLGNYFIRVGADRSVRGHRVG